MTSNKSLAMNQPEVGQLIPELRLLTGLTQEQFAASLGVTYPTISRRTLTTSNGEAPSFVAADR